MSPKSASRDKQALRRLVYKIIALISIPIIVFFTISYIESLSDRQIADLLEIFNFSKFGIPFNSALTVFLLLLFGFFAFFPLIRFIQKFFSALTGKYFVISLVALAVLGAGAALYIPSYTNWFKPDTQQSTSSPQSTQNGQGSGNQQNQSPKDPSSDLRLHLLYITGGVIAVLGLIETNRKNSQDHIRQVHAARRERYIEAVDKLSNKNAPVRLGGVYALVGLVDEWLDDDNIDAKTRIKEGQVIINNLCSYIRSPFSLALKAEKFESIVEPDNEEKRFAKNQSEFREEQDIRRTIFAEISKRSSKVVKEEGKVIKTIPGLWSDFEFDFSRAPIFYLLDELKIEKGNFWWAKFYAGAGFINATFISRADFTGATFTSNTDFTGATFTSEAVFFGANFTSNADFTNATFTQETDFGGAIFTQKVNFHNALFENYEPTFVNEEWRARFSSQRDQKDYVFSADQNGEPINRGIATLDGKPLEIPLGAVLFNPSSGETSEPAKPREDSDAEGEKPTE